MGVGSSADSFTYYEVDSRLNLRKTNREITTSVRQWLRKCRWIDINYERKARVIMVLNVIAEFALIFLFCRNLDRDSSLVLSHPPPRHSLVGCLAIIYTRCSRLVPNPIWHPSSICAHEHPLNITCLVTILIEYALPALIFCLKPVLSSFQMGLASDDQARPS